MLKFTDFNFGLFEIVGKEDEAFQKKTMPKIFNEIVNRMV